MKKIKTVVMLIILSSILITFSCTKEGKQGPAGTNGMNGTNGTNGTDGNANVYSYKFSVPLSSFIGPLTNNSWEYVFNPTTVMGGSTFIGANDVILMYLFDHSTSGTDYYNALPFLHYFNSGAAYNQHSFQIGATGSANLILISIRNSTGAQPYTSMTGSLYYKMIYIKSVNMVKPKLPEDLSYASVKGYYNLKD